MALILELGHRGSGSSRGVKELDRENRPLNLLLTRTYFELLPNFIIYHPMSPEFVKYSIHSLFPAE